MRVLVRRHKGYIDRVMAPMLSSASHDVVGLDCDLRERCAFAAEGPIGDAPHIQNDARDVDTNDLEGIGAVIYLTALSNEPLGNFHPSTIYSMNRHDRRLLYGFWGRAKLDGTYELVPFTDYRISKTRSERDIGHVVGKRPPYAPALRDCVRPAVAHPIRRRVQQPGDLGQSTQGLSISNQADAFSCIERGDRERIHRRASSP